MLVLFFSIETSAAAVIQDFGSHLANCERGHGFLINGDYADLRVQRT